MNDAYKKDIEELLNELDTSLKGIKHDKVKKLQKLNGKNVLIEKNKKTRLEIFLGQFKNIMIILLLIVGFLSLGYAIVNKSDFLERIVIVETT